MEELQALIVDDDKGIRDLLVEYLGTIAIQAQAYETAERLLAHLFPGAVIELSEMPDLLIIDLQLKEGHMQGIDLIKELVRPRRNVPSSIMAISGAVPSADFVDSVIPFGPAVLLPKPFGIYEFCPKARRLAEIGRNRRQRRIDDEQSISSRMDEKRKNRDIFISYAHEEEDIANCIRIHIESLGIDVWYGPTTLDGGDEWGPKIASGVDNSSVFIPIITDHYLSSKVCLQELARFQKRMADDEKRNLKLIPIVGQLSPRGRTHNLFKNISEKYHFIEFYPRIADCLTSLTMPLQTHIARSRNQQRRLGESPSVRIKSTLWE